MFSQDKIVEIFTIHFTLDQGPVAQLEIAVPPRKTLWCPPPQPTNSILKWFGYSSWAMPNFLKFWTMVLYLALLTKKYVGSAISQFSAPITSDVKVIRESASCVCINNYIQLNLLCSNSVLFNACFDRFNRNLPQVRILSYRSCD